MMKLRSGLAPARQQGLPRSEALRPGPDAESRERAVAVAYQPARWPEEQVYMVVRRDGDGEQRWLAPVYTVILVSHDRLSRAELGQRHCGQQGQENAFQGLLTDLGLQHPPCRLPAAQQGFYLGVQIAQLLLRLLCSRGHLRGDGLLPAASRRGPG